MLLLLFIHIENLELRHIANVLNLKDNRAAKKWLDENIIPTSKIGGKTVVDKFLFDFKRQQIIVEELKTSYPNNWFKIYDANTDDKGMVKSIRELYPESSTVKKIKNIGITKFIK